MADRTNVEKIRRQAAEAFATHTCKEAVSRSFVFRREDRRTTYWFRLTWTPGSLALTGDLGELTLVHGHALARFDDIGWALSSDHHYLMSKTNERQQYSPDETFSFVVEHLNEEALEALNGRRWREFVRDKDGEGAFRQRRSPGYRQELQAWRRALATAKADGVPEEDWPERPDDGPFVFTRTHNFGTRSRFSGENACRDRIWHIPDHWQRWVRLWRALQGQNYTAVADLATEHPDFVLLAKNRSMLKEELRELLGAASSAGELLHRIGFDDYYGSYVWPDRSYWQIAAIQHGVRMIMAGTAQAAATLCAETEAA